MVALMGISAGSPFIVRLENLTMDLRFRTRASQDPPADPSLVLVGIDEPSLERFGRWPWPRERHGDFCTLLAVNDASVVAFDILFTEPGTADHDSHLAE